MAHHARLPPRMLQATRRTWHHYVTYVEIMPSLQLIMLCLRQSVRRGRSVYQTYERSNSSRFRNRIHFISDVQNLHLAYYK